MYKYQFNFFLLNRLSRKLRMYRGMHINGGERECCGIYLSMQRRFCEVKWQSKRFNATDLGAVRRAKKCARGSLRAYVKCHALHYQELHDTSRLPIKDYNNSASCRRVSGTVMSDSAKRLTFEYYGVTQRDGRCAFSRRASMRVHACVEKVRVHFTSSNTGRNESIGEGEDIIISRCEQLDGSRSARSACQSAGCNFFLDERFLWRNPSHPVTQRYRSLLGIPRHVSKSGKKLNARSIVINMRAASRERRLESPMISLAKKKKKMNASFANGDVKASSII